MLSCKRIISSPFASHDSSPCSIQIDSKPNETHKFLDFAQVHEFHHLQSVMVTGFVIELLYVKRFTRNI